MAAVEMRRWVFVAWLLTGAFVVVTIWSESAILQAIGGLCLVAWGVAVSTNFKGAADAMPRRFGSGPLSHETSRGMLRLGFGFFALCGLLLVYAGLVRAL